MTQATGDAIAQVLALVKQQPDLMGGETTEAAAFIVVDPAQIMLDILQGLSNGQAELFEVRAMAHHRHQKITMASSPFLRVGSRDFHLEEIDIPTLETRFKSRTAQMLAARKLPLNTQVVVCVRPLKSCKASSMCPALTQRLAGWLLPRMTAAEQGLALSQSTPVQGRIKPGARL